MGRRNPAVHGKGPGSAFDRFAGEYAGILDRHVAISGERSQYFAAHKGGYIAKILGRGYSGKLLDFGCGTGLLAAELRQLLPNARIEGFDPSDLSIAEAMRGRGSGMRFFADEAELGTDYDALVVSNVLHHVEPAERPGLLRKATGRLVSGGRLFVVEHNPLNPLTRWVVRHCPFDEDAILLPMREVRRAVAAAGCRVIRADFILFFPKPLSFARPLESALTRLPLGAQYAVMGEKT